MNNEKNLDDIAIIEPDNSICYNCSNHGIQNMIDGCGTCNDKFNNCKEKQISKLDEVNCVFGHNCQKIKELQDVIIQLKEKNNRLLTDKLYYMKLNKRESNENERLMNKIIQLKTEKQNYSVEITKWKDMYEYANKEFKLLLDKIEQLKNEKEKIEEVAQKYAKKYHVWRNQVGKLQFEIDLLKQPIKIDNYLKIWLNDFVSGRRMNSVIRGYDKENATNILKQLGVKE